ncbi:RDD family protein [Reinekea sp.]|nr:RDD family protein [Reinekea sp.]
MNAIHYAGFWRRTLAALIDSVLVSVILYPYPNLWNRLLGRL